MKVRGAHGVVASLLLAGVALVNGKPGGGNGNPNPSSSFPDVCEDAEERDVVVVGSGWSGIVSAKLLKDYQDANSGFNFTVLEKEHWRDIGRGHLARYLMGGDGNPVADFLKQEFPDWMQRYEPFNIINVFDAGVASYFDDGVDVTMDLDTDGTLDQFGNAYQCLIDYTDNVFFDAPGGTRDESMRDALANQCGWPAPSGDTDIRRSVEYALDYEFSSTPDAMGLYNLPADRPNLDFGESIGSDTSDWFLTSPTPDMEYASSARIGEKFVMFHNLEPYIRDGSQGGGVAKIYWDNDDGSDFPVLVRTESSPSCYNIRTKKIIFTPSAGVLERRGDCRHVTGSSSEEGCNPATATLPLFDPVIPFIKMEATRRLFINPNRDAAFAGMDDYVELIFQFGDNVSFLNGYDKDFLIFNRKCRFWQNHDYRFYPGSKAVSCTLNSEEWDEFADPITKMLPPSSVQDLYENSILLLGAPAFANCAKMDDAAAAAWYPGNTDVLGTSSCGYTYTPAWSEDQSNNTYHYSYGAYVTWNVGKNINTLDQDFADFVEPLASSGVDRIYISGTAVCDRHQGWVHGGWYAGIKVTQEVLASLDPGYMPTEQHFCDLGLNNTY